MSLTYVSYPHLKCGHDDQNTDLVIMIKIIFSDWKLGPVLIKVTSYTYTKNQLVTPDEKQMQQDLIVRQQKWFLPMPLT